MREEWREREEIEGGREGGRKRDLINSVPTLPSPIREREVLGKDITPFILQRVNELTGGKSLKASILLFV